MTYFASVDLQSTYLLRWTIVLTFSGVPA